MEENQWRVVGYKRKKKMEQSVVEKKPGQPRPAGGNQNSEDGKTSTKKRKNDCPALTEKNIAHQHIDKHKLAASNDHATTKNTDVSHLPFEVRLLELARVEQKASRVIERSAAAVGGGGGRGAGSSRGRQPERNFPEPSIPHEARMLAAVRAPRVIERSAAAVGGGGGRGAGSSRGRQPERNFPEPSIPHEARMLAAVRAPRVIERSAAAVGGGGGRGAGSSRGRQPERNFPEPSIPHEARMLAAVRAPRVIERSAAAVGGGGGRGAGSSRGRQPERNFPEPSIPHEARMLAAVRAPRVIERSAAAVGGGGGRGAGSSRGRQPERNFPEPSIPHEARMLAAVRAPRVIERSAAAGAGHNRQRPSNDLQMPLTPAEQRVRAQDHVPLRYPRRQGLKLFEILQYEILEATTVRFFITKKFDDNEKTLSDAEKRDLIAEDIRNINDIVLGLRQNGAPYLPIKPDEITKKKFREWVNMGRLDRLRASPMKVVFKAIHEKRYFIDKIKSP